MQSLIIASLAYIVSATEYPRFHRQDFDCCEQPCDWRDNRDWDWKNDCHVEYCREPVCRVPAPVCEQECRPRRRVIRKRCDTDSESEDEDFDCHFNRRGHGVRRHRFGGTGSAGDDLKALEEKPVASTPEVKADAKPEVKPVGGAIDDKKKEKAVGAVPQVQTQSK